MCLCMDVLIPVPCRVVRVVRVVEEYHGVFFSIFDLDSEMFVCLTV